MIRIPFDRTHAVVNSAQAVFLGGMVLALGMILIGLAGGAA